MIHPLIVLCSRLQISGEAKGKIAHLLDSDLDWPNLIQSMATEATLPLVYRSLKEFEHKVPAAELGKLKNIYLRNTGRNMSMFKKLEPLLNAISDAGLMVALTRGARLAETVYRDWGLRHFVDVDFMVHPQEASYILEILKKQGIWTDSHSQRFSGLKNKQLHWIMETGFNVDEVFVDFHFSYPGIEVSLNAYPELWERIQTMRLSNAKSSIFSPEDEMCILCLHAQKHYYSRLIWLTDIAELANSGELDWDKTREISMQQDIAASVYHGMHLVNIFWPEAISSDILDRFDPGKMQKRILSRIWPEEQVLARTLSDKLPGHAPVLFQFFSTKRLGLKLKTLFSITFPPRAYVAKFYNIPKNSWRMLSHYLWRILRPISLLLGKAGKR